MQIKQLPKSEYYKIEKLHTQVFGDDHMFLSALKTKPYYKVFVAQSKSVVAYCIISLISGDAELIDIATDYNYRRKGWAKKLLGYCLKQLQFDTMFLEVNTTNTPAINLYLSCGFEEYNRRKKYYGDNDAICMKYTKVHN